MTSLKGIDMSLLECLDVLVRERSVTVAAERMQMGQGTMSNTLARLRLLLNDQILVRTGRGMITTDRALELQAQAQQILELSRVLLEPPGARDLTRVEGAIRIVCADATALIFLGPVIKDVRRVAPGVRVELTQISNFRVTEPLEDGSADLAVGAYIDLPSNLHISRLITGEMLCVVGRENPLSQHALQLEQVAASPHAILSVGYGYRSAIETMTDQALAKHGVSRTVRFSSQYATVMADVVARSDLMAVMPRYAVDHYAQTLPLTAVAPPIVIPDFSLSLVWHPRVKHKWLVSWIRELLRTHARGLRHTIEIEADESPKD